MILSGYFKIFSFCLFVFLPPDWVWYLTMRFLKNVSYLWFLELLEYFFLLPNLVKFWSLCFQITFSTLHPYLFLFFLWTPVTHVRLSDIFSQVLKLLKVFPILFSLSYRLEDFTEFFFCYCYPLLSYPIIFFAYIEGFRISIGLSLVFKILISDTIAYFFIYCEHISLYSIGHSYKT